MRYPATIAALVATIPGFHMPGHAQESCSPPNMTSERRDAVLESPLAVGFVSTTDAERARRFYGDVLGLELTDDRYALVADVHGAQLRITTIPGYQATEAPVFGFNVPDVPAAAARLRAAGVDLIRYSFLGDAQDADGIWTSPDGSKLAWFRDPDGNVLVLGTR